MEQAFWLQLFISGSCVLISTLVVAQPRYKGIAYPLEGASYDIEFVYNFTKYLHGIYRYHSFLLYAERNSRFRPNFMLLRDFEQALLEDFNVPITVWSSANTVKFREHIGLNNLVFVQFGSLSDPILNTVDYTLGGLHFITILFYFRHKEKPQLSTYEIKKFFAWCWQRKMVNVALTYQSYNITFLKNQSAPIVKIINKVYSYTPFPNLTVYDLTLQIQQGGGAFMIERIRDVKGYEFRTPMVKMLPYVFLLKDPPNCQLTSPNCKAIMAGTTGRLYSEYIKQINGKIKIEEMNITKSFEYDLILAASRDEVHIGVVPFSRLTSNANVSEGSYPIAQTNACIIVPLMKEIDKAKYFQSPFQPTIWILISLAILIFMLIELGVQYKDTAKQNFRNLFGRGLITTSSVLLAQAYVMKYFYKRNAFYKLLHIFMLIMTFLLSSMYTASLTSFFSSVQLGEQIDTLEQFMASGLKILMTRRGINSTWPRARLPQALVQSFKIVDDKTLSDSLFILDPRYAYMVNADQWLISTYKQQQLSRPLFRMPSAELCSETHFLKLPLQWNSPFDLSLALFIMQTQETGLAAKWREMSIAEAKYLKLMSVVKENDLQWRPLKVKDYHIFAFLILALWCLSCSCFLREKFCYKKQSISVKKFQLWQQICSSVKAQFPLLTKFSVSFSALFYLFLNKFRIKKS